MASAVLGKVSPTPKGEYVSTQDYDRLDVVTYEGYPYLAKSNVPSGNLPTDELYWMPLLIGLDFAPGGYGLGVVTPKDVGAPDNALETGEYVVDDPDGGKGWLWCDSSNAYYKHQTLFNINAGSGDGNRLSKKRERWMYAGIWQPWEYVNPPMMPGVEYRTTERYWGKPVYCKLVNCGALPDTTEKLVYYADNGVVNHIVRYSGEMFASGDTFSMPYTMNGVEVCVQAIGRTGINLYASYNASGFEAYVTVWYIKN